MSFWVYELTTTYQRLMENVLAYLNLKICCVFIDDVIFFGKTYEVQLHNIQLVFDRIKPAKPEAITNEI